MKIGIIVGSQQKVSQSAKVGEFLNSKLKEMSVETWTLDLGKNPLPLYDSTQTGDDKVWTDLWKPIDENLKSSEGFIIITPEYGGMASPAIKNFFLHAGLVQLGHKPGLLVSVSSGRGGAFPINEMRASSYKNTKICYIPEQLIFRDVEHLINGGEPVSPEDSFIRERSGFALKILVAYAGALSEIRESGVVQDPRFKNGMS
ncbi:NADPH-dependent oxidoreductase [Leptospira selangorensis]|uniref:NADPH-dependent oxidoreductase n=1 Tax=Leptospira selangorensis TaxID=2484982 RepID=A0A5F2C365_9LEPT|nr:NAD(P)H-dependent oxidoreductase [Leptospira selangorensis]TGM13357.1 NADPH-dependent oxidoreductase [Leptospira selangorensis]TGM22302.1 NADPH-dependent oxidoreductase [Leptospira selangorensis]